MASGFQWRNHPIKPLHGANSDDAPLFSDWTLWKAGTERAMGAVGASYILRMITDLDWEGVGLPVFLEMPPVDAAAGAVPTLIQDHRREPYRKKLLELAVRSGKVFPDEDPTADSTVISKNFLILETEVTSFGSQLFESAKAHFSSVFMDSARDGYAMKPLLEWKIIEKLINPKAESDPGKAWIAISNLVQMEPQLTEVWMTDWVAKITKHRNDLVPVKGADAVDSLVIANVIARVKHAQTDLTQSSNMEWKMQAIDWHKQYTKNSASYTWETLKDSIFTTIGEIKNANTGSAAESVGTKRPRLQPSVPQGMALTADNSNGEQAILAAVQAALAPVQAALATVALQQQQAVPHSQHPAPASLTRDPRCSNCGGMGHWRAVCPSPVKASNFRGNEQQQQQAGPPRVSQRFARRPQNPNAMRGRGRGGPATQMQRPGAQFANPLGQTNAYGRAQAQSNPFVPPTQQTHMGVNANATGTRRNPLCLFAMLAFAILLCLHNREITHTHHTSLS